MTTKCLDLLFDDWSIAYQVLGPTYPQYQRSSIFIQSGSRCPKGSLYSFGDSSFIDASSRPSDTSTKRKAQSNQPNVLCVFPSWLNQSHKLFFLFAVGQVLRRIRDRKKKKSHGEFSVSSETGKIVKTFYELADLLACTGMSIDFIFILLADNAVLRLVQICLAIFKFKRFLQTEYKYFCSSLCEVYSTVWGQWLVFTCGWTCLTPVCRSYAWWVLSEFSWFIPRDYKYRWLCRCSVE
jgi:hypothetical protein